MTRWTQRLPEGLTQSTKPCHFRFPSFVQSRPSPTSTAAASEVHHNLVSGRRLAIAVRPGSPMQNRTASPSNSYDSSSDYSSEEEQERQMAEPEPSTSSEAPLSTQTPARVPPLGIGKLNLTHTQPSASAQARSSPASPPAPHSKSPQATAANNQLPQRNVLQCFIVLPPGCNMSAGAERSTTRLQAPGLSGNGTGPGEEQPRPNGGGPMDRDNRVPSLQLKREQSAMGEDSTMR